MTKLDGTRRVYIHRTNRRIPVSTNTVDCRQPREWATYDIDDIFSEKELQAMFWHFRKKDAWWYKFAKNIKLTGRFK